MRVAFRVDASHETGTGHVMRCLAVADALRTRGATTRFLHAALPGHLGALLEKRGHETVQLSSRAVFEQLVDARESAAALEAGAWDWLVADHYAVDEEWERRLRPRIGGLAVIDDLANRRHDCDLLLDQNLYEGMDVRYRDRVPSRCRLLLGPRYALLRSEFAQIRRTVKVRRGPVKRILVCFGGVDAANCTGITLAVLAGIEGRDFAVDVVVGAGHRKRDEIEAACAYNGFGCHSQTVALAELMAAADLSIGAGGVTTWERCSVGLPALAFPVAANQRQQLDDAALAGVVYVPGTSPPSAENIADHARALLQNPALRSCISRNGLRLVDGRGVERLLRALGASHGISVREAVAADSRAVFGWRNEPAVRGASRQAAPIQWADHAAWFERMLREQTASLLIGERDGIPVGVVRFDVTGAEAEVSIYLAPGSWAPGTGSQLLAAAEAWFVRRHAKIATIVAEVLHDNAPSHGLFSSAGYELKSSRYRKQLSLADDS